MNKIAFNFYVNRAFRRAKYLARRDNEWFCVVNLHGFIGVMHKSHIEATNQQSLVIKEVWP